jgi:hypothetical protein
MNSIAIPFKLRRATDGDAETIADLFFASYRLLTFLPMLHTIEGYHRFVASVMLKEKVPIRPPGSWHNLRASFRLPSLQALRQDPRHALGRFDLRSRFRRVHCLQYRDGKHRCGPASAPGPQDAKGG